MLLTETTNQGALLRCGLLIVACLAWLGPVRAQSDDAARTISAGRLAAGEAITLDGSLSHPAWARAPVWQRFIEKDPRNGAEPPQQTRVRCCSTNARCTWV